MLHSDSHQRMEFSFEGQFLGFIAPTGKLKYLRLRVLSEEMQIKLPKAVRSSISLAIQPGESIQVTGIGKFDRQAHELKLKATQITLLADCTHLIISEPLPTPSALVEQTSKVKLKVKPKIKVLVCQKSGCLKKGGKGLCELLEKTLCDRNLNQYVTVRPTGCLKRCSSAPNLVMAPGNRLYTEVRPKKIGQIADVISQSLEAKAL